MSEPFLGEIRMVGFNFAPVGWAFCQGQLLPINQNQALFALLGTIYGGNGSTTFALPDLRGRVAMGFGQGSGLSNYAQGQVGGSETVTLASVHMPAHSHSATLAATGSVATAATPGGNIPAKAADGENNYASASDGTVMTCAVGNTGGSQSHPNMPPYLVMNFIIALQGIFPPRS